MKKPFGLRTLIWLLKGIFVRFPRVQYDGSRRQNRNTSKLYINRKLNLLSSFKLIE